MLNKLLNRAIIITGLLMFIPIFILGFIIALPITAIGAIAQRLERKRKLKILKEYVDTRTAAMIARMAEQRRKENEKYN